MSIPEYLSSQPEDRPITAQDKLGEAAVWALGASGTTAAAAMEFIDKGKDSIAGYSFGAMAVIATYAAISSIRKSRDLRRTEEV